MSFFSHLNVPKQDREAQIIGHFLSLEDATTAKHFKVPDSTVWFNIFYSILQRRSLSMGSAAGGHEDPKLEFSGFGELSCNSGITLPN